MSDVAGTLAGLDALAQRVNDATERIVKGAADIFKVYAQANAPIGEEGNSTNPPGDLKRSIIATDPVGGDGEWRSVVGPTVESTNPGPGGQQLNFGAQREWGGVLTPNVSPFLIFSINGAIYMKSAVYQFGSFYLTRARAEGPTNVDLLVRAELTAAVNGY